MLALHEYCNNGARGDAETAAMRRAQAGAAGCIAAVTAAAGAGGVLGPEDAAAAAERPSISHSSTQGMVDWLLSPDAPPHISVSIRPVRKVLARKAAIRIPARQNEISTSSSSSSSEEESFSGDSDDSSSSDDAILLIRGDEFA